MKIRYSTLKSNTPLKRKTPLISKTPLKKISHKAQIEYRQWFKIKIQRMKLLEEKYGYIPCEYCKRTISYSSGLHAPDPHHNDWDRRNNTLENCRIVGRVCHSKVHKENIRDVPSLL